MLVSDEDVNNYNKIKTDLDKLRLLVEQSELWVYKKKESQKDSSEDGGGASLSSAQHSSVGREPSAKKSSLIDKNLNSKLERDRSIGDEQAGDQFVLQELDNGPELDASAILKYKELYKILYSMIKLCVHEVHLPNGTVKKKARRNDQRLLRNMGVHNIVLDLTKISYDKSEDKRMKIIMKTAHEFLQNFCYSNPHNQVLVSNLSLKSIKRLRFVYSIRLILKNFFLISCFLN